MDFIKNAVSGSGDKKAEGSKPAGDGQDYGDEGTLSLLRRRVVLL